MCNSQWDGEYEPVTKAKMPLYFMIGEDDEYYSSKPFKDTYKKLHDIYQKQGLSEKEIGKLLALDVKGESYFEGTGITYQHGGGFLFCRDKEIMGWLFAQEKASAKKTKDSITLKKSVYTLKIPTEFHVYEGLGHGFGLGTGTVAAQEQEEDVRPELTSHIEGLDEYGTILVGYPNWLAYHNLIQCTQLMYFDCEISHFAKFQVLHIAQSKGLMLAGLR